MTDSPYLVSLALLEQNGSRRMPLGGCSIGAAIPAGETPGKEGEALALDLLLRLWQQSDGGEIKRAAGDQSLWLLEMPMERLMDDLPSLKKSWLAGGSTEELITGLRQLASQGWQLSTAKYAKPSYSAW